MSDPFDNSADDIVDELAVGRGEIDGTWTPDWIVLSGASARACQLYQFLRLRLNRRRRDRRVWPGLATLAVMMDLKTSESVSPYVKELERLGAIDVEKGSMPRRNIYRVNTTPPPGYAGPLVLEDWDNNPANRLAAKRIRDAEKAKRDRTRSRSNAKPQVKAEPGKNPDQARPAETPLPDPGKIPDQDPGKIPVLDPGFSGVEPLGVTPGLEVPGSTTPSPNSARSELTEPVAAVGAENLEEEKPCSIEDDQHQEEVPETAEYVRSNAHWPTLTPWEDELVGEIRRIQPLWERRWLRKVIGSRTVREMTAQDPELVRRAFRIGACDSKTVPMRFWWIGQCPHWKQAAAELQAERDAQKVESVPKPRAGHGDRQLHLVPEPAEPAGDDSPGREAARQAARAGLERSASRVSVRR